MKHCDWCEQESRGLRPLENRDIDRVGLFIWVCDGCKEAIQSEYWCEALCSPIGFRIYPERPATLEVQRLTTWAESMLSSHRKRGV